MKSILVVDDLGICRSLIEKQLHMFGEENVDFAFNGKETIEKIKAQKYDLVFMDINMPVMDGLTATKIIRNSDNSYMKNLPIIVLTSNCLHGDVKKSLDAGCTEYIVKPLDLSRLKENTRKMVAKVVCRLFSYMNESSSSNSSKSIPIFDFQLPTSKGKSISWN